MSGITYPILLRRSGDSILVHQAERKCLGRDTGPMNRTATSSRATHLSGEETPYVATEAADEYNILLWGDVS